MYTIESFFLAKNFSISLSVTAAKRRRQTGAFANTAKALSIAACLFLPASLPCAKAESATRGTAEYAVKAAYIYNILRFVNWDENSPLAKSDSLNICLFRADPFNRYLEPVTKKTIHGKPIKLKRVNDLSDTGNCHLIFVANSNDFNAEKIIQQNKRSDSILLGNNIQFVKNGGLFGFSIENNKVKLLANRHAIDNSRLKISSMLIEVSRLYGDQP